MRREPNELLANFGAASVTPVVLAGIGVLLLAVWAAAPLFRSKGPALEAGSERLNDLSEAKQAVYRSILDLEFDLKMDKVSRADYELMRRQHEAEALKILAETDAEEATVDALELEIAAARRRLSR